MYLLPQNVYASRFDVRVEDDLTGDSTEQ
jgi:hypothetical protein